ncbi:hypothetical protein PLESTB_001370800 [Pleodorina starrii]|uniref:Uncharacterized protein n=1 Tax=Pleodorina starrii TaxID=330485 RepID=A0A9W6F6R1_9CHLO|nr:hypothetical protein PLESTB_001370800 [Pleodorina starrii]
MHSTHQLGARHPCSSTPTSLGRPPSTYSHLASGPSTAEAFAAAAAAPRPGAAVASRIRAPTRTAAAAGAFTPGGSSTTATSIATAIDAATCRTGCRTQISSTGALCPSSAPVAAASSSTAPDIPYRHAVRMHGTASNLRQRSTTGTVDDPAAAPSPGEQNLTAPAADNGAGDVKATRRRRVAPGRIGILREAAAPPESQPGDQMAEREDPGEQEEGEQQRRQPPAAAGALTSPSPSPLPAEAEAHEMEAYLKSRTVKELRAIVKECGPAVSRGIAASTATKPKLLSFLLGVLGSGTGTDSTVERAVKEFEVAQGGEAAGMVKVEEEQAAAAQAERADGGGAAARRRRRTTAAEAAESGGDPGQDPFLDELFAAMDLDVSVAMRDPREIQAAASTSASASAAAASAPASVDGAATATAAGTAALRRRRAAGSAGPGLDPESDSNLESAARTCRDEGGDASLRRRTVSTAATEEGTAGRRASRGPDAGPLEGPSAAREAPPSAGARAPAAAASASSPPSAPADSESDSELGPEYDMPPWPPLFMGEMRTVEQLAPGDREAQEELLLGNVAGMSLTVLGSAAVRPTDSRALASLAMGRVKDIFIFDAGDDTQRQVAHAYHVKPSKIYRIFLTSLEPEAVLGLPGLMCIINSSRERGHEIADIPVHVYGPPGTADFLAAMMRVSHTCLEVTIVVHEISTGPVPTGESEPYLYVKRARIWRVAMPPDQLNPRGGVDASLLLFAPDQGRSQKKRGRNAAGGVLSFDTRAGFLPFPPLEPGNPYRRDLEPAEMRWTLELDITARVIISLLPGNRLSYTVLEADRGGALVMERATAAGLVAGRDIARLKAGEAVINSWGRLVVPSLVVSPNRPGRRVVVLGSTSDPSALSPESHPHMAGADVLVAGGVWPQDEAELAVAAGGCTTDALGRTAQRLGVRYVLLSRFDGSRLDEQEGYAERAADEVAAAAAAPAAAARGAAARRVATARGNRRSVAEWRRRVFALGDLESAIVDKNEGPKEVERADSEE